MSVIYKTDTTVLLDHKKYVNNLYKRCHRSSSFSEKFQMKNLLFSIKSQAKANERRKRKIIQQDSVAETTQIKEEFKVFLTSIPEGIRTNLSSFDVCDTSTVRDMSKTLFESIEVPHNGLNGGNNSDESVVFELNGDSYLSPPHSRFFCGDVIEQCKHLESNKYNIVLADPPWWNKFIRRLKAANTKLSYSMMYNEQIAEIPVKTLLAPNALVAVWCTNSPSNIDALKNHIFPKWGVQYLTTWYWLKVTTCLEPVCEFGFGHQKQPFERIIIGKVGDVKNVPEFKLFVSVPSALHSHKPPLLELLEPLINEPNPQTLELFARYLLPRTTSVGYEPLKWQHISLYDAVT